MPADSFNLTVLLYVRCCYSLVFKVYVLKMFVSVCMFCQNYVFVEPVICPTTVSSLDVFQQHLLFHTCLSLLFTASARTTSAYVTKLYSSWN